MENEEDVIVQRTQLLIRFITYCNIGPWSLGVIYAMSSASFIIHVNICTHVYAHKYTINL